MLSKEVTKRRDRYGDREMTKVVVVLYDDIFTSNGTTVRARRVIGALSKNYNLALINCSGGIHGKLRGMESVHLINAKGLGRGLYRSRSISFLIKLFPILLWELELAFIILKDDFDIVYCASDWYGFLSVYLVSKVKKYKTIFEAHAICSEESKEAGHSGVMIKLLRSLEKFVITHSDFILALSKNTFEFYQVYNDNIELVPVFVDTDVFRTKGQRKRIESRLVGLIGPFASHRQVSNLHFLYARIENFDNRIPFVVIGHCEERIKNERIKYTGYLGSVQDYIAQLSRLDGVLVSEKVATSGPLNKIIEPMSCGIPVFTTPYGMVGLYYVEHGKDILVFEEGEIIDKVNELIFDDKLMKKIGKNARITVEKYYSKKANEKKLINILEMIIGEVK